MVETVAHLVDGDGHCTPPGFEAPRRDTVTAIFFALTSYPISISGSRSISRFFSQALSSSMARR